MTTLTPEQEEWEATMGKATGLLVLMLDAGLSIEVAVDLTVDYYTGRGLVPSERADNETILTAFAVEKGGKDG